MPGKVPDQDHYAILDLPFTNKALDEKIVKVAYRRALLLHHPDKSGPASKSKPTVDQITVAYKTIIDPAARSEYDRTRALNVSSATARNQSGHSGLETVDLDDLLYDEARGTWYRNCRCGRDHAFVVTEEELENNIEYGEILTGCQGCSLWLRVTFAVAEEG